MNGHDFPNGYTIVPYIKGLVKSRHDETASNISLTLVFQNVNPCRVWGCASAL
jgi:hypothetical protein